MVVLQGIHALLKVCDNSGCTACTLALQFIIMRCMISQAGKHHITSHQHVEFGEARRLHDLRDMNKCIDWFRSYDPFVGNVSQLRSLSSWLATSEDHGINCDESGRVGSDIRRSLDSLYVRHATIKRRHIVHTLTKLKVGCQGS